MPLDELRILAISPHLDDAVLSIGEVLSAAEDPVVATVFAGSPNPGVPASDWDRGLSADGCDAGEARRREDTVALRFVGAHPAHLRFLEASYRTRSRCHEFEQFVDLFGAVRQQIADLLETHVPEALVVPLGVHHVDHLISSTAALSAWFDGRPCAVWVYAEQPYADRRPALVRRRLADLRAATAPAGIPRRSALTETKRQAVGAYRSQIGPLQHAFPGWDMKIASREHVWRAYFDPALGRRTGPKRSSLSAA